MTGSSAATTLADTHATHEARASLERFAAALARLAVQYASDSAATKAQTPAAGAEKTPPEAAA